MFATFSLKKMKKKRRRSSRQGHFSFFSIVFFDDFFKNDKCVSFIISVISNSHFVIIYFYSPLKKNSSDFSWLDAA